MKTTNNVTMNTSTSYGTNYAIFQWSQGQWVIYQNSCDYGCVPAPPMIPGEYDGQLMTTACVPLT